jgi:hypothetical protein
MTGTQVIVMAWGERLKQTHSMKEGSTLKERRWDRRMKEKLQHSGGREGLEAGLRLARISMARASAAVAQGASSCRPSIARSCSSACCHRPSPPHSTSSRPTASLFHNAFQNPAALTMECSAPLLAANSVSSCKRHGERAWARAAASPCSSESGTSNAVLARRDHIAAQAGAGGAEIRECKMAVPGLRCGRLWS